MDIIQQLKDSGTRIRLSYSTLLDLHSCERFFQIERLQTAERLKKESVDFTYGHSWGAAVQEYLLSGDMDKAVWQAFRNYTPWIETDNKFLEGVILALRRNQEALDSIRMDWEVPLFKGKPAIELGFTITVDDLFYYVGFMDVVLKHKQTGVYAVVDVKSTGYKLLDLSPLYCHSGQALGYSLVLDQITQTPVDDFTVFYISIQVYNPLEPKLHKLPFKKTVADRLAWLLTLKLDCQHVREMLELDFFPKRGSSCIRFNRPCQHFGVCHMHSLDKYHIDPVDPHEADYSFHFKLDEIISDHVRRVNDASMLNL